MLAVGFRVYRSADFEGHHTTCISYDLVAWATVGALGFVVTYTNTRAAIGQVTIVKAHDLHHIIFNFTYSSCSSWGHYSSTIRTEAETHPDLRGQYCTYRHYDIDRY